MLKISLSERKYLLEGIEANIRADGRRRLDYRDLVIETSLLSQSNGSARVMLPDSDAGTDVLASVKLEVAVPRPEAPNAGIMQVFVQCCPSVSEKLAGRAAEEMNIELSQQMNRLLSSCPHVDMEKYCIVPGESVWQINVDVMVFESSGNLTDIISMAVYAALNDTLFPSVRLVGVEDEDKTIEVESDPACGQWMDATGWPICVTLSKIGDWFVADASQEEEFCMSAQVSIAVDPAKQVCGIQKSGKGAIEMREMQAMIDEAITTSSRLFGLLGQALAKQKRLDGGKKASFLVERHGFLC